MRPHDFQVQLALPEISVCGIRLGRTRKWDLLARAVAGTPNLSGRLWFRSMDGMTGAGKHIFQDDCFFRHKACRRYLTLFRPTHAQMAGINIADLFALVGVIAASADAFAGAFSEFIT